MKFLSLFLVGLMSGALITLQSVLNSALGRRVENLGAVLLLTVISISVLLILIVSFPNTANLRNLPGISEWYLYVGGIFGIVILAAPIFLIPRLGTTTTLTALVTGQLMFALLIDQFGWFHAPHIEISWSRILGVLFIVVGVVCIGQK